MHAKAKLRFMGVHPEPFESVAIVNRRTAKKKFALLIAMIETIDGRCVCICPKLSLAFDKPATTSTNRHNHARSLHRRIALAAPAENPLAA
jgi:hypothetical protein